MMMLLNTIVIFIIFFSTEPYGMGFYLWLAGWLLLAFYIVLPMVDRIKVIDKTD